LISRLFLLIQTGCTYWWFCTRV